MVADSGETGAVRNPEAPECSPDISPDGEWLVPSLSARRTRPHRSAAAISEADTLTFALPEVVLTREQTKIHRTFGYRIDSEVPVEDRFISTRENEERPANLRYDLVLHWGTTFAEGPR